MKALDELKAFVGVRMSVLGLRLLKIAVEERTGAVPGWRLMELATERTQAKGALEELRVIWSHIELLMTKEKIK